MWKKLLHQDKVSNPCYIEWFSKILLIMSFPKWSKNCTPEYKRERQRFPYKNMKTTMFMKYLRSVDLWFKSIFPTFHNIPEAYLRLCQKSMTELFWKNNLRRYLQKSLIIDFDRVLHKSLHLTQFAFPL